MIPDDVGIMLVMAVGVVCIALCIFMERWERRGRDSGINVIYRDSCRPMGSQVPTIEETQK